MFWNKALRRWEHHPDCTCHRDPCICANLRPLDRNGKPLPAIWAAMEDDTDPNQVTLGEDAA